jgi:hypothetical protein
VSVAAFISSQRTEVATLAHSPIRCLPTPFSVRRATLSLFQPRTPMQITSWPSAACRRPHRTKLLVDEQIDQDQTFVSEELRCSPILPPLRCRPVR